MISDLYNTPPGRTKKATREQLERWEKSIYDRINLRIRDNAIGHFDKETLTYFGIDPESITESKELDSHQRHILEYKLNVPALVYMIRVLRLNPDWVLYGEGPVKVEGVSPSVEYQDHIKKVAELEMKIADLESQLKYFKDK